MNARNLLKTFAMLLVMLLVTGCEPQVVHSATLDAATVVPKPTDVVTPTVVPTVTKVATKPATSTPTATATTTVAPKTPVRLPSATPTLAQAPFQNMPAVPPVKCTAPQGYKHRDHEFSSELRDVEVYAFDITFNLEKSEIVITPKGQQSYTLPLCTKTGCVKIAQLEFDGKPVANMKYLVCGQDVYIKMELLPVTN